MYRWGKHAEFVCCENGNGSLLTQNVNVNVKLWTSLLYECVEQHGSLLSFTFSFLYAVIFQFTRFHFAKPKFIKYANTSDICIVIFRFSPRRIFICVIIHYGKRKTMTCLSVTVTCRWKWNTNGIADWDSETRRERKRMRSWACGKRYSAVERHQQKKRNTLIYYFLNV